LTESAVLPVVDVITRHSDTFTGDTLGTSFIVFDGLATGEDWADSNEGENQEKRMSS
jgi:hypothetical protein